MLLDGALSLTTVQLVARRLTRENHERLLAETIRKTKREVEHLLARWFPQPDVPDRTRKLPAPKVAVVAPAARSSDSPITAMPDVAVAQAPTAPQLQRAVVAPLSPDRYKVTFTADTETTELLELAKDMLSHSLPGGDTAEVVKRALKALVRGLARKKFGATDRPRRSHGPKNPSDIPAAIKAEVWVRDGGRCAFLGSTGRRCGSRWHVQFHHLVERCQGGRGTAENIQLRCGAHNRYEAQFEEGVPRREPWPSAATRFGTSAGPLFA